MNHMIINHSDNFNFDPQSNFNRHQDIYIQYIFKSAVLTPLFKNIIVSIVNVNCGYLELHCTSHNVCYIDNSIMDFWNIFHLNLCYCNMETSPLGGNTSQLSHICNKDDMEKHKEESAHRQNGCRTKLDARLM